MKIKLFEWFYFFYIKLNILFLKMNKKNLETLLDKCQEWYKEAIRTTYNLVNSLVVKAKLIYNNFIGDNYTKDKVTIEFLLEAEENDIIEPLLDNYIVKWARNDLSPAFDSIKSLGMIEFLTKFDCNSLDRYSPDLHNNVDVCRMLKRIHDDFPFYSEDSVFLCMKELSYHLKYHHSIKEFIEYLKQKGILGIFRDSPPSSAILLIGYNFTNILNTIEESGLTYRNIIENPKQFLLDVKNNLSV